MPRLVVIPEDDAHLKEEIAGDYASRVDRNEPQAYNETANWCRSSALHLSQHFATSSATSAVRGNNAQSQRWRTFLFDLATSGRAVS